ncbi:MULTISPECIES: hypothetical protein [Gracilibacillus]|nr:MULTISPECIES: hypothetical protein [Gracilibacillus]
MKFHTPSFASQTKDINPILKVIIKKYKDLIIECSGKLEDLI